MREPLDWVSLDRFSLFLERLPWTVRQVGDVGWLIGLNGGLFGAYVCICVHKCACK